MKWKLAIINWNDINNGVRGGIVELNTTYELFMTLQDVWNYIGGRLKKQRCGYSGIRNNIEYVLTRW